MLQSARMHISEMNSARATRGVSDALVGVQGVADIGVSPDRGIVEVKFDPTRTDEASIHEAIRRAGYNPRVYR